MSARVLSGIRLAGLLTEEGLLPPNCRAVELFMPLQGALSLRYEVFIHEDDLPRLARVFLRLAHDLPPPFPANREVQEGDLTKPTEGA